MRTPVCAGRVCAQVLSPEYQERMWPVDDTVRGILASHNWHPQPPSSATGGASSGQLVMGETSSYWGGGLANVSNRFASGELGVVGGGRWWVVLTAVVTRCRLQAFGT